MRLLMVDNYDSFTYNLVHLFAELGADVVVRRNDAITPDEADELAPTHLVVSPGPGRPEDAGASLAILERLSPRVPTLGVCLGHQALVQLPRRDGRPGAASSSTARRPRSPTTAAASSAGCPRTFSPAATTHSQRRRCPTSSRSPRPRPTAR